MFKNEVSNYEGVLKYWNIYVDMVKYIVYVVKEEEEKIHLVFSQLKKTSQMYNKMKLLQLCLR